jgi:hypothetical protein
MNCRKKVSDDLSVRTLEHGNPAAESMEGMNALNSKPYVQELEAKNALVKGRVRIRVQGGKVAELLDPAGNVVAEVKLVAGGSGAPAPYRKGDLADLLKLPENDQRLQNAWNYLQQKNPTQAGLRRILTEGGKQPFPSGVTEETLKTAIDNSGNVAPLF